MLEWIAYIFNIGVHKPLVNTLVLLYEYIPGRDFGLAIVVLTILVRLLLYPLNQAAIKSQKALAELQPKLKNIQERWKDNKEKQVQETLAVYKEAKVNPFASLMPILIQLPILIALFRILGGDINGAHLSSALYGFIRVPHEINFMFLDRFDLSQPHRIFAFLAGFAQFFQTKMLTPKTKRKKDGRPDFGQMIQTQSLYVFPLLTVVILFRLPSALALYWIATTVFAVLQQYLVLRKSTSAEAR